ncbi:MAG: DJ-1/PfpI family protein [Patescibacteria group bacterium]
MGKIIIFIIIILLFLVGSYFLFFKKEKTQPEESKIMPDLSNNPEKSPAATNGASKIAMIIAFRDFRDEEYFVPRDIFEDAKAEIKVASSNLGTAQGADGGEVSVDIKLSDLDVSDFDALVFIGGPGALSYLDNSDSYKITKDAISQNKLLAAICVSPAILAKAGVLNGKKATVWTSPLDKSAKKILEDNGAIFQDQDVVQDGNIITGSGPSAAKKFANKIVDALR